MHDVMFWYQNCSHLCCTYVFKYLFWFSS